ncbi:MAG: hypothetical protein EXR63_02570 [Dehalococcoidia bacterium]|nr:hypothetical protein [Dehalococcoidia bacterium]
MPDANYAEQLEGLEEAVEAITEALGEVKEGVEQAEELTEQLDGLTQRIKDAQQNPDSLNADTYADLALDLIMVIPDNLPLPDRAKKALRAVGAVLAAFIQGATGLVLVLVGRSSGGTCKGARLRRKRPSSPASTRSRSAGSSRSTSWACSPRRATSATRRCPGSGSGTNSETCSEACSASFQLRCAILSPAGGRGGARRTAGGSGRGDRHAGG